MIEFELIDDTQTIEADLIDDTENIEVGIIKEIDKYPDLKELPSINDVTLIGNKTLHELGIQAEGDYATNIELQEGLATKVDKVSGKGLSTNDYTTLEKEKLASLENYDDTEVRELIDAKQPRGNYLTEETDPTVPNHVKSITQEDINNWNNPSFTGDYEELSNLPQINNVELIGNKSLSDLGIQPAGNYLTEETDPTVPNYVKNITQNDITNWNNKADKSEIPDVSNFATKTELGNETTARENADIGLQGQIDAITSSSDVKDIVGTYTELQNYDTSTLGNDDIIKVLQDNTHNNAMTYYRWIISGGAGSWQYVGQEGPYYTKSETETLLNNKQDEITSLNKLDSDLVDDTNQTNKFVTENEKITWNTEIENLHEEDELLKRNLQTTTGSGEEVTLEKTTELDFVKPPLPRGNTKQDTPPNPDNVQEIRNVTGNVEVTISNENNTESKTLPVSLGNIELCKIDNYQDYLYKSNGKWYKYNAINKVVLNGSEIWGLQSINSYGIANFQKSQPVDTIAGQANLSFCDKFSPQTTLISATKDVGYFLNTAKVLFIRFDSSIANTAATFKTWLSQHNVTLYYVLGTATSTEITDATLISQLEEISKTLSYQGQTNITSNTIALFDVEAYQDLKIILDEKYVKPSTGITKTDLASAVQTSLGKADTAVQKDGGSATQTVSLTSGTGTTAFAVKSRATSSYISFSGANAWIGSIGVTSDKKPTFYNGASYTLAYTSDIPTKTSDLTNDSNFVSDPNYAHTDNNFTTTEKNKLASLQNYDDTEIKSDINDLDTNKQDKTDNNLQTTNKTITSAINEVNSVAKGANQAVGYNNYSDMITAINTMDDEEFSMGQNIYIVTVEVPDLWVSSVESTSSTYTYVDDATVINDLNTNGYIQVGYYKLSMLETQKVDLTNYVTNTDYANTTTAGAIKTSDDYGTSITSAGVLIAPTKTYQQYQDSTTSNMFISKGTLENVITGKDLATKSDMPKIFYGSCATAAATAAKVVVCEDFTEADLVAGTRITILFTNANSFNGQATLNINSTGAKNIYYNGTATNSRYMWVAGESVDFIYNGTQWATINGGLATTTYYGVTKLATGANSDSQAYALTPRSLYYFANYSIAPYYSASRTYAVGDKVRYTYYIYECITAIDTPESWNVEHWQQIDPLQAQIDALEARIKALENS